MTGNNAPMLWVDHIPEPGTSRESILPDWAAQYDRPCCVLRVVTSADVNDDSLQNVVTAADVNDDSLQTPELNAQEHLWKTLANVAKDLRDEQTGQTGEGQDVDIPLGDREQELLQAALELQAFNSDSRKTTEEIVTKAIAPAAEPNAYKKCLSNLVHKNFLESKQGSHGGYWLTESGKERAEKLKKG